MKTRILIAYLLAALLAISINAFAQQGGNTGMVSGKIMSEDGDIIDFAMVYLKDTRYGCSANREGLYHIEASAGNYTLVVSAIGYKEEERAITITEGQRSKLHIKLKPQAETLDEVVVMGSGVSVVNRSAFNAVSVDAKGLHNSSQDLASTLVKVPGIKIRESGGVGSDMQLSIDGFTGKHIKIFIDGVPQDGAGGSFSLNNLPVNYAERIEVYKGVVPVGFGTDAIGGVVNIVTNKTRRTFVDVSYTYGSFNTHKSNVCAGHTTANGWLFEINAFQNYSDNSYYIDTPVKDFETGVWDKAKLERVKRFHDTYHNEAVVAKAGIVDKKFADRLTLNFTYSQNDKEIQNGVIQEIVYGQKRTKSRSFMPSIEWRKRNLITEGLDVSLTANYNKNFSHNIDTATCEYNWRGETRKVAGKLGEQAYQDSKFDADNWNGTFTASYRIGERHTFVLNHVLTAYTRRTTSAATPNGTLTGAAAAANFDKKSLKNITGLSYRYSLKDVWNISVFGKYYNQKATGPANISSSGYEYIEASTAVDAFGYGLATTYFLPWGIQAKLSYERALRMPTIEELFGDEDLEMGSATLSPEKSHNANFNLSYGHTFGKHSIYVDAGFVYRYTHDYIRRTIGSYSGGLSYASHENHGKVQTLGFNAEFRYTWSKWIAVSGNVTSLNSRDDERYVSGNTKQESTTYKVRMPNTPYLFANGDVSFYWQNLFGKGNLLTVSYSNNYVHEFPLYWENLGDPSTKKRVPDQLSHDASLTYSIKNSRYNISLECKNFTDAKLYDNYSLQKPGRAFYIKLRYYFSKMR